MIVYYKERYLMRAIMKVNLIIMLFFVTGCTNESDANNTKEDVEINTSMKQYDFSQLQLFDDSLMEELQSTVDLSDEKLVEIIQAHTKATNVRIYYSESYYSDDETKKLIISLQPIDDSVDLLVKQVQDDEKFNAIWDNSFNQKARELTSYLTSRLGNQVLKSVSLELSKGDDKGVYLSVSDGKTIYAENGTLEIDYTPDEIKNTDSNSSESLEEYTKTEAYNDAINITSREQEILDILNSSFYKFGFFEFDVESKTYSLYLHDETIINDIKLMINGNLDTYLWTENIASNIIALSEQNEGYSYDVRNPMNIENTLLMVRDGVVYYDFVDELN